MEYALIIMTFALPFVGFVPPMMPDGWTTYRDRALILLAAMLLVSLSITAVPFAIVLGLLFLRYRSFEDLHGVVVWGSVIALWLLVGSMRIEYVPLLVVALIFAGLLQSLFGIIDYVNMRIQSRMGVEFVKLPPICGSLGNRTYLSAYIAMIAPLVAVRELWWLFAIFLLASVLCGSRGGLLAFVVGTVIAWPASTLLIGLFGLLAFLLMLEFDASVFNLSSIRDTMRGRFTVWKLTISGCFGWPQWLIGSGFGSFYKAGMKWVTALKTGEGFVHAHNDFLQFYFEYGLIGYVALGLFIYQLMPYLTIGHSLTGSLAAVVVVSLFTFPHHIGPIAMTIAILVALTSKGVF